MAEPLVVLLTHGPDDPVATAAVGHLARLAFVGVVRPFWWLQQDDLAAVPTRVTRVSAESTVNETLFRSLGAAPDPSVVRVAALATAALRGHGARELAGHARVLATTLRRLQPPGVRLVEARIAAPEELGEETALIDLLSPEADANVVVVPEDRRSDGGFAVPVGLHDPDAFAGHVATELATQVGLWAGMATAPVDDGSAGVVDDGDTKTLLCRSYARLAVGPPLPLHEAMTAQTLLPAPPGTDAAPSPIAVALDYADRIVASAEDLRYEPPRPFIGRHEQLSVGSAISRLLREAGAYVLGVPRQMARGVASDLTQVAGDALSAAVGDDSLIEVTWAAKDADAAGDLAAMEPQEIRRVIATRLEAPEPVALNQQLWARVVDDVFAAVDGGPTSPAIEPLAVGDQRVVLLDPATIGPDPSGGLDATISALMKERVDAKRGTLLGRLSARLRDEETKASEDLDATLAVIEEDISRLKRPHVGAAGVLSWLMGLVVAAIVAVTAIGFGWAEAIGVRDLTRTGRTAVGAVIAFLTLAVAFVAAVAGLRKSPGLRRAAWITMSTTFAAGMMIGIALADKRWDPGYPFSTIRAGEAVLTLTVIMCVVEALVFCASRRTATGRAGARLAGGALIGYVTVVLIGSVVRASGWYARVDKDLLRERTVVACALLFLLLVLLLLLVAAIRVRERLSINTAAARLAWSIQTAHAMASAVKRLRTAVRQYHGTAAAITRIVWWPFGRPVVASEARQPLADGVVLPLKLQVLQYEFSDRGRTAMLARIRRQVADAGWLQRQYGAAVEGFRPAFALQTGRDLESVAGRRPETDAAVDALDTATSRFTTVRWEFARLLFDGGFDRDLRQAGTSAAMEEVLEQYFQRADGVAGARSSGIGDFGAELVAGQVPALDPSLFERLPLPVSGDERAQYHTTVWWPTEAMPAPVVNHGATIRPCEVAQESVVGMIVPFVRSDWSMVFPLHRLPIAPERSALPGAVVEAKADDLQM